MIVVAITPLAAIAIPNFVKGGDGAEECCINNLRKSTAPSSSMLENKKAPATLLKLTHPYLKTAGLALAARGSWTAIM
jgi:hypothetical protein